MIRLSSVFAGFAAIRDHSAALLGVRLLAPVAAPGLVPCRGRRPVRRRRARAARRRPRRAGRRLVAAGVLLLAWGANEKQPRPDRQEDRPHPSRPAARSARRRPLLTALAVPCFLPLLLAKAQDCFGLFLPRGQPGPLAWLWFLLDKTYLRALPDAVDLGFARLQEGCTAGASTTCPAGPATSAAGWCFWPTPRLSGAATGSGPPVAGAPRHRRGRRQRGQRPGHGACASAGAPSGRCWRPGDGPT